MFAKLKKKIEDGGGAMSPGSLSDTSMTSERALHGPGLASPIKTYGASPFKRRDSMGDFETVSASSEVSEVKATTTKEDLFKKIMKKNDQIKKLEGKITDLAAMIKERNKNIERLEHALEKQRTDYEQRIQELDARYQTVRSKSSPLSSPLSASGKEPFSPTILKLQQENEKLKGELKEMQSKQSKEPAESELASVREMLSMTQKDLEISQSFGRDKDAKLQSSLERSDQLEKEIQSLMSQIGHLTTTNEKLEESLREVTENATQTRAETGQLEQQSLEYKQKVETELAGKDERIAQLKERVQTLEQRIEQSDMSGDEQTKALQQERNDLEEKLLEVREQLTLARTAGSERSAQLLQQVTQLNTCLTEERSTSKQHESRIAVLKHEHEAQTESLKRDMEGLKKDLKSKESEIDKSADTQKQALEKEKRTWTEKEAALLASVAQLTNQLEEARRTRELDAASHEQKLEIALEAEGVRQSKQSEKLTNDFDKLQKDLKSCANEKDELLVRNATLSQEFEAYKRKALAMAEDGRAEIQHKNHAIAGLESVLQEMQPELEQSRQKITELERQQTVAIDDIESAEVSKLQEQLNVQEEQLIERNKTIKKQQQRLADLKKTLQRELKVQPLPNDEIPENPKDSSSVKYGAQDSFMDQSAQITNGFSYNTNSSSNTSSNKDSTNRTPMLQVSSSATVNMPKSSHQYNNRAPVATNYDSDYSEMTSAAFSRPRESPNRSGMSRGGTGALEYDRDINFNYLRHVVLKFMLSRESEAVHLIKAVAVLLDFSNDEQRMLKDTLEYKMSWFGSRPKLGEGQFSKYVPPSV